MTLSSGTRLGPYEVLALLGAGGMGEVYRACDMRLGREVAIKVLPAALLQVEAMSLAERNCGRVICLSVFSRTCVCGGRVQRATVRLLLRRGARALRPSGSGGLAHRTSAARCPPYLRRRPASGSGSGRGRATERLCAAGS